MRHWLERHSWWLHGAFILAVAFLLSRIVHVFTEFQLSAPVPGGEASSTRPIRIAQGTARTPLSEDRLSRLLGVALRTDDVPEEEEGPPRSARRARLVGTLTSREAHWSLASVEDLDSQRVRSLRVGDVLQDSEVVAIERGRVIVTVQGRREVIDRGGPSGAVSPMPRPTADTDIRRVGEHTYEVPGRYLDLERMTGGSTLSDARMVPAFKDGKAQGFKVLSLRKGSLYEKLGLQNGDVLQRINGMPLDSLEKAMETYMLLKSQRRLEVEIERGGVTVRKVYDVQP
ncbi:general secretion pathway protein GspC [Myxococcus sp. K38C18041901]|uniref:type II secretion system protein GspC n=1 Tax=Myxococcus guangdongensis TaxID=2906760 RepID=UPI0020A80DF6|nr:type II secretion system protein GspC [Myxococcus guangdongensis]MCP3064516.1 general secretion pathway protein GspC [Myxococcus guangdongensis]